MSDPRVYLWLIPAFPLLASIIIAFFGPRFLRGLSHWPCILAIALSFVCSALLFFAVKSATDPTTGKVTPITDSATWFSIPAIHKTGEVKVQFGLMADPLTAVMLSMITFVGTFIAIYSAGYMHGDEGYPRFFAEMSLFVASMTILVLADNFLLLYLGWEGVGLCSYLLIGFWYAKPSAADAARKAFLVTRLGDAGLMVGILVLWRFCDYQFDYDSIFKRVSQEPGINESIVLLACLLLFCGAAGKSAQFPLHVWLPDAMEGPTPVSALIHAATMVTAGVYLVARCTPLFVLVPVVQLVVACIGAFTALLAALIALTQTDLKRVLAYSTLSQLGYMFLALGCAVGAGERSVTTFAVTAAIFHLFTHGFFKALLFLSAGSVMHAMGGVIDMRQFGGLRKLMPLTHAAFLCGALALAAVPIFSGFWSKDEILASALAASSVSPHYGTVYMALLLVGVLTAGLTGFYTFRAYYLTFWGDEKIPHEAGHHAHESPRVMTVPLLVLSVFALFVGLALGPTHLIGHFLDRVPRWPEAVEHGNVVLMICSTVVAVGGVGLAYLMYRRRLDLPAKLAQAFPGAYQLSLNKFYIDELYAFFIIGPLDALSKTSFRFDFRIIDGLVDLVGAIPGLIGSLFRYVQNGLVQFYALAMVLGLVVFIIALLYNR